MSPTRVLGYDLAVLDLGRGPAGVVLVHGIGASSRHFGPLARELAGLGRVLAPDLPGFGASAGPERALTIPEHAAVVAELIRSSGLERPVLVGHSMGAQVVTEVAAANPGLVERVVLVGPGVEPGGRTYLRQGWRLLRDARYETPRANAIMVGDWLRCGPRRFAATLPAVLDYRIEERLPDVDEPVLLVRGGNDPVAPADFLHELAAVARDATVLEIAGEGHIPMFRRPTVFADLCRPVRC